MKKHIVVLLVVLLAIGLFACEKPEELEKTDPALVSTDTELVIDNELVELLETVTFSDGHIPLSSRSTYNYVVVNEVLYLYIDGGELYHLNTATGFLTGLCEDPLSEHKVVTCPNKKYKINSAISCNDRIYVAGQQIVIDSKNNMKHEEFVGYYDVSSAEYVVLDSWEIVWGYGVAGPIQIYEDELYYLKKESDTVNNLWKTSVNQKNRSKRLSLDNEEFIKGFLIKDDVIYYSYISGEAIYSVDMAFNNRQIVTTESMSIYTIIDDVLLGTNYGVYDPSNVEWDVEEYEPSDTPYEIFRLQMSDTEDKEIIVSHIQGASSVKIDHGIITTTPDNPTYLGMEVKNGEKIYYVNLNSGCVLVGMTSSDKLQTLDLSIGLGIDYSVAGIYYIDDDKCIVQFQAENKETENEGIYIIKDYNDPQNCTFHKISYEPYINE